MRKGGEEGTRMTLAVEIDGNALHGLEWRHVRIISLLKYKRKYHILKIDILIS